MALELAKAGFDRPSHLILHLKNFKRSESFVRVIKCIIQEEPEGGVPQAVRICAVVRKMWKLYESDMKCLVLKVSSIFINLLFSFGTMVLHPHNTPLPPGGAKYLCDSCFQWDCSSLGSFKSKACVLCLERSRWKGIAGFVQAHYQIKRDLLIKFGIG